MNIKDDIEVQNRIIDLYLNQKVTPVEIAKRLGFKNHQPIYNFLNKKEIFKKHYTGTEGLRTYNVDETFFEIINTEEKAYILGFITADGYIDENRNALKIALNVQDIDILEKIKLALKSNHPIKYFIKDKKYNHVSVDIGSKKIVSDLKKLSLYQGKSLTMTGKIIKGVNKPFIKDFLRGYFDGDGCIHYGKQYSSGVKFNVIVVGTKDFLEKTYNKYCDTNCSIFKYKSCNMYGWRVASKSKVDIFLDYIYNGSVIYLERKYDKYLQSKNYIKECAHVKPGELLETVISKEIGNQQPSPEIREGSETIERQS